MYVYTENNKYIVRYGKDDVQWFLNQWPSSKHWPSRAAYSSPATFLGTDTYNIAESVLFKFDLQTGEIIEKSKNPDHLSNIAFRALADDARIRGAVKLGLSFVLDKWPHAFSLFLETRGLR